MKTETKKQQHIVSLALDLGRFSLLVGKDSNKEHADEERRVDHMLQDVDGSDEWKTHNRNQELSRSILLRAHSEMGRGRQPFRDTIFRVRFLLANTKVEGADQATNREECMGFVVLIDRSVRANSSITGREDTADDNISRLCNGRKHSMSLDNLDISDLVTSKHVTNLDLRCTNKGILDK